MADSVVEICNDGLVLIGAQTIGSLTENSKPARLCNQKWTGIRDAVLRAHPWNCALSRRSLAQVSEDPAFEFAYQYRLPNDPYCLRVLDMYGGGTFKVEGRLLLTNESTANIKFISRVADPTVFDSLLVQTLAARLASDLAYPIAGKTGLSEAMWKRYEAKLSEARGFDAQEGTTEPFEINTWVDSRWG